MFIRDEIVEANKKVHSKLAQVYNENEPHFRPENIAKVSANLKNIVDKYNNPKLLDVGCGTGFIINIVKDWCEKVYGIDVTQEMLDRIEKSKNVELINGMAENLPFEENTFEVATAYSFIHHLHDYKEVLNEMYRVLKKGGTLYIDLEPNKHFWQSVQEGIEINKKISSQIVEKEILSVNHTGTILQEKYNIDPVDFDKAEYYKNILGGIDPYKMKKDLEYIGFKNVEITFEWFIGEGYYLHNASKSDYTIISNFLTQVLPVSENLYKYFKITAEK